MKIKFSFFVFALFLLASCEKSSVFSDHHIVVNPKGQCDTISGALIVHTDSFPGIAGVVAASGKVIARFPDRDPFFTAFSEDGDFLMSFGSNGRARNEFMSAAMKKQCIEGSRLVVNDVNSALLKVVDLDETLEKQTTQVVAVNETEPAALEVWFNGTGDVTMLQQSGDNFLLRRTSEEFNTDMEMFVPHAPSFPIYQCRLCADKTNKNLAMPMLYMNQVNFYSFDSGRKVSTSVYSDAVMTDNGNGGYDNLHLYYCSVCTDGELVYALYMDQPIKESYNKEKPIEIHVFDFNGHLRNRFCTQEYLTDIAVDNSGHLYGSNIEGNIYKYEIPE